MRQLCNVAYEMQAEAFSDQDAFDRWSGELDLAPGERWFPRTRIAPSFLGGIPGPRG